MSFSEKFLFRYKVQNVASKMNHCLHHDVITLRERDNSDPGNPTFSGVSEGNTNTRVTLVRVTLVRVTLVRVTIVSLSLQGNTE